MENLNSLHLKGLGLTATSKISDVLECTKELSLKAGYIIAPVTDHL